MLKICHVNVSYREMPVLFDVSLSVAPGEIVSLIGPNGAGKSTIFKGIMHLDGTKLTGGKVLFDDEDITRADTSSIIRKGLIYSPQGGQVFPDLTVEENLKIPMRITGVDLRSSLNTIYGQYSRLGERRKQPAGSLSGGERQMLALARALACRPRLLLLDEPSIGLSPKLAREAFERIRGLKSRDISVFIIEQRIKTVLSISDRTYVMGDGRVRLEQSSQALIDSPELEKVYFGGG